MPTKTIYENRIADYQRQEILTMSPGQLISKLYSIGIRGCHEKDMTKVSKVLIELISALDFTYKDISLGFYRLYDYCLRMVKVQKFDEALKILQELDQTWRQAIKNA